MPEVTKVWHFTQSDGKGGARLRDGRPVIVGEKLTHDEAKDGPIDLCVRGYHGSVRVIDALETLLLTLASEKGWMP